MKQLEGKVALVTGASRGIGRSIAVKLGESGAKVAVNYSSSREKAEEVVKELQNVGAEGIAVQCSVESPSDVEAMFKTIESSLGSVDVLVNNAGVTRDGLLMRMKVEDWEQVVDVNLKSVFLCTKAALRPMMKKRYGKIINISSVVGFTGNPGQMNYAATKSGVIGVTKTSALEFASKGIRVNAVAPGFIESDMTDILAEDIKTAMKDRIALNTFGKPEDVANTVLFLASEQSDYITGQVLHVNGGLYM